MDLPRGPTFFWGMVMGRNFECSVLKCAWLLGACVVGLGGVVSPALAQSSQGAPQEAPSQGAPQEALESESTDLTGSELRAGTDQAEGVPAKIQVADGPVQAEGLPTGEVAASGSVTGETQSGVGASGSQDAQPNPWLTLVHHVGVSLDVGVPDAIALSAVYQPVFWGQVHLGLTYNLLGTGLRTGVTLIPLDYGISPTLTFDVGHFFETDISDTIEDIADSDGELFSDVAYTYINLHLGFITGGEHVQFFMRGGMSYLDLSFSGGESELDDDLFLRVPQGADVNIWTPSLKLGFLVYFY